MHEIHLKGMVFSAASVGILPEERTNTQPIEIDLLAVVEDGDDVVDYRGLYDATAAVMNAGHVDYLEEIGDRVARGALAHSDRIRIARVAVRKPRVRLGGPLDYAEVVVTRVAGA